jgi:uncharacterized protein (DUF2236 family)
MALPLVPALATPVTLLRTRLAGEVHGLLAGGRSNDDFSSPPGDPGWFGPDSMVWRVHADMSMLVGGLRALFLQTMHPLAMAGVAQHSDYKSDPLGRLERTGRFVGITSFGSSRDAERAVRQVRAAHRRVTGTAPDGRPYEANDPALLRWVHVTEVDSFHRAYQRYGGDRLTVEESDRYFAEAARVAVELGATDVPTSVAEVHAYFHEIRPELLAGELARDTAWWLCAPPLPLAARPAYTVLASAAIGLLPRRVRRDLRLVLPPLSDDLVVRPATRFLLGTLGWVLGGRESPLEVATARASA